MYPYENFVLLNTYTVQRGIIRWK